MSRFLRATLCLLFAANLHAQAPNDAVLRAREDVARVRADRQPSTRYLCLPHVADKKELAQWDAVLAYWSNSLSREADIVRPRQVSPGLWRVDIGDYRWPVETWEKLAETEPYFTVRLAAVEAKAVRKITKVIDHKGGDCINPATGNLVKNLAPGRYSYEVDAPVEASGKVKAAFGPWVEAKAALALADACQSQVPIVRLDWWLAEVTTGNDRGTGYYDWLALGKKEADWHALIGADIDKARALQREIGALVSRSTVTLNNRALERFDAISGPYWRSRDYAKNTDVKNALRLLDGDIAEDASEQYGSLPNRLWAFWLQDAKGNRADAAPDNIASDGKATGTDRRVRVGLSCVRCHAEGIRPINDWARKVYQPPFALEDRVYEETKRKRSKYLSDLAEAVEDDQARYAKVLRKVNGLTPADNAKAVADAYANYAERDRDLAAVALELGIDAKVLLAALKAEAARTTLDPVLAGLVQGVDIRVEHLEEVVPLIYEIAGRNKP